MPKKTRKNTRKTTTKKRRRVECKKQHGHLVCWINSKKTPNKKHIFIDFVIPSKRNQHKPHLIRRSSLIFVALMLATLQIGYNYWISGQRHILGYATNVSALAVTDALNEARKNQSQTPLLTDSSLSKAASLKADDMLRRGYWSHNSPDGEQPWHWFDEAGYSYQNAGENLAKDFKTSAGVVKAWLDSKSHRDNLLNPIFENIGIAVVNGRLADKDTTLVVALFGTKKTHDTADQGVTTSTTLSGGSSIFANPAQISALTNPMSLATILILMIVALTALITHWHYVKLPKKSRKAWYMHHALYTAIITIATITYTAYALTSGSI